MREVILGLPLFLCHLFLTGYLYSGSNTLSIARIAAAIVLGVQMAISLPAVRLLNTYEILPPMTP